jgi:hypothetical protein
VTGSNQVKGKNDPGKGRASNKGQRERFMWRNLTKAVRELQRSLAEGGTGYRPDLHYMRGPGPKWRAKYGNLAPKTMPTARTPRAAMRDAAGHHA